MSEIKQVWGIIKDYQCADLEMVQGPALAVWKSQQAIIDDLKTQLNNMEACYIGVKKQVKSCESLVGQWREKRMGGWSDYARGGLHSRQDCADDLEKTLRGEHE